MPSPDQPKVPEESPFPHQDDEIPANVWVRCRRGYLRIMPPGDCTPFEGDRLYVPIEDALAAVTPLEAEIERLKKTITDLDAREALELARAALREPGTGEQIRLKAFHAVADCLAQKSTDLTEEVRKLPQEIRLTDDERYAIYCAANGITWPKATGEADSAPSEETE